MCKEKNILVAREVSDQEQLYNFNPNTGEKLHDVCPRCWVKGDKPYKCGFDKCPGYELLAIESENMKNDISSAKKSLNESREVLGLNEVEDGDVKYALKELTEEELKEKRRLENNKKFFDSIATFDERLINEKEYEVASKIISSLENIKVIRATSILNLCIKAIQYSFVSYQQNK